MGYGENIWNEIQSIVNKSTSSFRDTMDSNVHCMDVGIQALKASDPKLDYATKEKLHRIFRKNLLVFTSLEEAILYARDKSNRDRTCFVEDPQFGDFIVGPSYDTLQRRVSAILKESTLSTAFTGTNTSGKTTTNIGRLSVGSISSANPLENKLTRILEAVQNTPIASSLVSSKLNQLHKFHNVNTTYSFTRKNFDLSGFEKVLGTGTVLVVLQTSAKKSAVRSLESKIDRELREYLTSEKFHSQLLQIRSPTTLLEDIATTIINTIKGIKLVSKRSSNKSTQKASENLLSNKPISASKPARNKSASSNKTISLTSLHTLINRHLQDVIAANMGNGSRRDILNYRTGRFAASATVERLSLSRTGMVAAFYSYMKNPYATFSGGGAQSIPTSRDPKLLIAKSIREIAAEKVVNRLRAVSL